MKSKSEITNIKGRKLPIDKTIEKDARKAKYFHVEDDKREEEISIFGKNSGTGRPSQKPTTFSPSCDSDSLLRQIEARLSLLRQQHKQTERQIQYIIDESKSNPDMFIIQQAKLSKLETENNANMSTELMVNLQAISKLLSSSKGHLF